MRRELESHVVGTVWFIAIALGLWWRIAGIDVTPLYGDEFHGARVAVLPYAEILRTFEVHGTHVPLPLLQRACVEAFGPGLWSLRLPALVFGVLSLVLLYPIARPWVGRGAALVATCALAVSPLHIYYSRFARAYALEMFLALVLVWSVHRWRTAEWKGVLGPLVFVVALALLPWVHLASAGLVLGVALAAAGVAWADAGRPTGSLKPLVAAGVAAGICYALYVPLLEQLTEFLTLYSSKTQERPDGAAGVLELLGGGRVAGGMLALGLLVATAWLARDRPATAAVLGAAVLGPVIVLVARMPHGMEYAYARYLLVGLPLMLTLAAWLPVRLAGERWGLVVGVVLVAAGYVTGPRSPWRADDRPFDNTYLALADLPAFNRPYARGPELYAQLAVDPEVETIIEAPALTLRTVMLLRNYRLTHGKRVLLGLAREQRPDVGDRRERFIPVTADGPYVLLDDIEAMRARAQILVLHKRPTGELEEYWRWVFEQAWPLDRRWGDAGLMGRLDLETVPDQYLDKLTKGLKRRLTTELGEPIFQDPTVVAWDLR